jgi:hypothetical protein
LPLCGKASLATAIFPGGDLAVLPLGEVPPEVVGLPFWELVDWAPCDVEVDVFADEVVVDADVAVFELAVDGATLEVVVSEETPADWVAVELPPQPASRAAVAIAATRMEGIRFVGIGRSAYSTDGRTATSDARRF